MATKLPDIHTHFSDWYNEVIFQAELCDLAPVKGCMVLRPYGYAIWENIQQVLDKKIKETGHHNAAFPLLIPMSFLTKEAEHVEGFSPELAVVTHAGGKELEEPLVVRPTSETIIHAMFARWLKSWRDLPIKINQWCSVVRWEMRTRPFLRTTEFWWQEGHTAHETAQEALEEAELMLSHYVDLAENYLAVPVVAAVKPDSEKFPGADKTYTFEGLMPDGKALQMGTSHLISQNFAKAFDMTFQDKEGKQSYPHLTSWGVTTRLIGALIMTHGDHKGLVLPPAIAPIQVVIIPIIKGETKDAVIAAAHKIAQQLKNNFRVVVDADDSETPGAKFFKWELKGVPLRIELGPRDLAAEKVVVADRLGMFKEVCAWVELEANVKLYLERIQKELHNRAVMRRAKQWFKVDKIAKFGAQLEEVGGFYQTGWCGNSSCEIVVKQHKATIRCVLASKELSSCFACEQENKNDILVARAY